jgi:hypothetical protein
MRARTVSSCDARLTAAGLRPTLPHMNAGDAGAAGPETAGRETFNPWTVVNLVFHHLADSGLHPVLGETGDPAVPATALLRAMGIEPGRNDESVTSGAVQDELAALRARFLGDPPA